MRDRAWIIAGLLLFLAGVTYPVWRAVAARSPLRPPDLVLPKDAKQCVAPVEFMRTSHMKLLLDWRERAVRDNQRKYVAANGQEYEMSLSGTCLKCHEQKGFCDRCHTFAGVSTPYCFECHIDPKAVPAVAEVTSGKWQVTSTGPPEPAAGNVGPPLRAVRYTGCRSAPQGPVAAVSDRRSSIRDRRDNGRAQVMQ